MDHPYKFWRVFLFATVLLGLAVIRPVDAMGTFTPDETKVKQSLTGYTVQTHDTGGQYIPDNTTITVFCGITEFDPQHHVTTSPYTTGYVVVH